MPNFDLLAGIATKITEYAKMNKIATYGQLSRDISGIIPPRFLGRPLGWVSSACKQEGYPMLTAIIISQSHNRPGEGFFSLYRVFNGTPINGDTAWYQECEKVFAIQDWSPMIKRLKEGRVKKGW